LIRSADSGASRPPIPEHSVHPSGPFRPVVPAEAVHRLRGDLDVFVLMALRKEPERRYGGPAELAADVRRYQTGRTVRAGGDAAMNRGGPTARRSSWLSTRSTPGPGRYSTRVVLRRADLRGYQVADHRIRHDGAVGDQISPWSHGSSTRLFARRCPCSYPPHGRC
jgi:hypothetical protein